MCPHRSPREATQATPRSTCNPPSPPAARSPTAIAFFHVNGRAPSKTTRRRQPSVPARMLRPLAHCLIGPTFLCSPWIQPTPSAPQSIQLTVLAHGGCGRVSAAALAAGVGFPSLSSLDHPRVVVDDFGGSLRGIASIRSITHTHARGGGGGGWMPSVFGFGCPPHTRGRGPIRFGRPNK